MLISELGMRRQRRMQLGTQRPVIVVPGYLGTKLKSQTSNKPVWGHFGFQGVLWTAGRHLRNIAIPMRPGVSVVDLKDDLIPSGLVGGVLITYLPFCQSSCKLISELSISWRGWGTAGLVGLMGK